MYKLIDRLKLIFLAVFAIASVGSLTFHAMWIWPEKRCEAKGDWWDWRTRSCAHPVLISDITGRTIPEREAAAAKAALARRSGAPKDVSRPASVGVTSGDEQQVR
jgi:hypothetical protein